MKYWKVILIIVLLVLLTGVISIVYVEPIRGIPFVENSTEWSIGIYVGDSLFSLAPSKTIENPVLTARDVTDVSADFVTDPFMVRENSTWYMFFEVMNRLTHQGDIGCAISSDGFNWVYQQIVLDEPFELSYPYVFKCENEYYMVPESRQANSIRLYKAIDFPTRWLLAGTLLDGSYLDPSVFHYEARWWIFAGSGHCDTLHLFYADDLVGPWAEHPQSPIIMGDANIARPGGRVLIRDRIVRYAQDDDPTYGNQVRAFEVTTLTTESYEEREATKPIVLKASGTGWNAAGMHNIDPHQIGENRWIACVDGYRKQLVFGWGR